MLEDLGQMERKGKEPLSLKVFFAPLLVTLEMGDVPLVSVLPESLQLPTKNYSQGHLITHLQELLQVWVLWSAVKSRWVIVGKHSWICFVEIQYLLLYDYLLIYILFNAQLGSKAVCKL